jgi:hypothetical protein
MFRFAIRDLLWLTALAAVGAAWWSEMRNRGPENTRSRVENARLAKECDRVKWQLDSSVKLLAHRGVRLEYRENSVQVRGDFRGTYSSRRGKKSESD